MSDDSRLPHEKGFHISWDQIHRDSRALAWRLDGHGPDDGAWRAVVAITRGGMAPAMIAARELDIRTVDTISIKSYDHQAQSEAKVLKQPDAEMMGDGTGILSTPSPKGGRRWTRSSLRLAKTLGFSSRGIWPCNMSNRIAGRIDPLPVRALRKAVMV